MATSDASFRLYENIGYGASDLVAQRTGTFRTYENVGYYLNSAAQATGIHYAYLNTGIEPLVISRESTVVAYENIGVQPGTRTTVLRYPRGWGVIPTGPQTIIVLNESSSGTATAYENTV